MARQLELGLDAVVDLSAWAGEQPAAQSDLPGIAVSWGEGIEITHHRERPDGTPHDVLCRRIATPDGVLTAEVNLTPDWADIEEVSLFDDWLVPRSRKFLIETRADLAPLRHILAPPAEDARTIHIRREAIEGEAGQ